MIDTSISKQARSSGIELLKILAIFIIVISHVTQTLTSVNTDVPWTDYMIDISKASANGVNMALLVLRTFGIFGNSIFFISSAWFLLNNDRVKAKKELKLFLDVWTISVLICGVVLLVRHGSISGKLLVKQFFPTLVANNWYMTCYLLFYPIHGILNKSIRAMSQRELLLAATALGTLYILVDYVVGQVLFPSMLILWITIYVIVAYAKLYMRDLIDNNKVNVLLVLVGILGNAGIIIATDLAGMKIGFLQTKVMYWANNCSPFLLMAAFGLFNIFRNIEFSNRVINYISKLSLFIYLIHENMLLRTYYRPMLWHEVYNRFGYSYVLMWLLILAVGVFTFGLIISILYEKTIGKGVEKATDSLLPLLRKLYAKYEMLVMQLH